MKTLITLFAIGFVAQTSLAFELPKGFETREGSDEQHKFWINPDNMETVSTSKTDVQGLKPSGDALKEIKKTAEAKAWVLSEFTQIKNWKISDSQSERLKDGQIVWFFGSYTDSSNDKTYFAEVYSIQKSGDNIAYLFTRGDQAWTKKDINQRFKVNP